MISVKYKGSTLIYDEKENKVYEDGLPSKSYEPSFVNNGEGKMPTFLGFTNTKNKVFISISGKEFKTVEPNDLTI